MEPNPPRTLPAPFTPCTALAARKAACGLSTRALRRLRRRPADEPRSSFLPFCAIMDHTRIDGEPLSTRLSTHDPPRNGDISPESKRLLKPRDRQRNRHGITNPAQSPGLFTDSIDTRHAHPNTLNIPHQTNIDTTTAYRTAFKKTPPNLAITLFLRFLL